MKKTIVNEKTVGGTPLNINLDIRIFGFLGLILILGYAFLGRGLYFEPELLTGLILISILFILAVLDVVLRGETYLFSKPLDFCLLLLAGCYLVSFFTGASKPDAMVGVLKYTGYALIYLATVQLVSSWRSWRILLEFIFGGAVMVALIGLLSATGHLNYPGAFVDKAILSTLQYQNALAIFLAIASILGFALWSKAAERPLKEIGYLSGLLLMNVTLLSTGSRAVWVMFPILLLLWLFGIPKKVRARMLLAVCYVFLVAILVSRGFLAQVAVVSGTAALTLLFGGVLLALAGWLILHRVNQWIQRKPMGEAVRKFWQWVGLAYLVVVLGVYAVYAIKSLPGGIDTLAPVDVTSQLGTVNSSDNSYQTRFVFYQDALKLVSDHPLIGTGAGGWKALYPQYRTLPYVSSEVHNGYLQVLVETGLLGFLIYLSTWVLVFYTIFRSYKRLRKEENWPLLWGVCVGLLFMALHSGFDFDLSIPTLSLLTWLLVALLRKGAMLAHKQPKNFPVEGSKRWLVLTVGVSFGVLVGWQSWDLLRAGELGAEGAQALAAANLPTAEQKLQSAALKDSYTGSYQADLAKVKLVNWLNSGAKEDLEQGLKLARQAVEKEPYNLQLRADLITVYQLANLTDQLAREEELLIKNNPMEIKAYELMANAAVQGAINYRQKKDLVKEILYLNQVLSIPERLETIKAQVGRDSGKAYKYIDFLKLTPKLQLCLGQASLLLGKTADSVSYLEQAGQDPQLSKQAANWLAVAYKLQGDTGKYNGLVKTWVAKDSTFTRETESLEQIVKNK